ncbi:MAG: hypothetical protein ACFFCS_06570 [Candidatus Hodarchaeota archaeon]
MLDSNRIIRDRDKKIDQARKEIACIRKDVESLKKHGNEMDFTTIEGNIDALEEIIQKLPKEIPEITIISHNMRDVLKLLKGFKRQDELLDDIETRLVLTVASIHVVGLMQKIIQDPERPTRAPKGKIWKDVKACFPKFMGFKLRVLQGATRLYAQAHGFMIEFKKKNAGEGEIPQAMEAFLPYLESFVSWEVKRYRVSDYHKIWYNDALNDWWIFCDFRDEDNWGDYTR